MGFPWVMYEDLRHSWGFRGLYFKQTARAGGLGRPTEASGPTTVRVKSLESRDAERRRTAGTNRLDVDCE
jgi:hypothetical protein